MTDIKTSYDRIRPQPTLEDLGYLPEQAKEVAAMADLSPGLRIVAGVTGAGKSTTVAAVVAIAQRAGAKVVVLQDTLEPTFEGLPHIKVDENETSLDAAGGPWAKALQQSMRSAPDLFVIGELRNEESVRAAIDLVGKGCCVWTTVHSAGAHDVLQRLHSMGINDIEGLLFSPFVVTGLIHQTRAPKLSGGDQILAEVIRPDGDYLFTSRIYGANAAQLQWMQGPSRLSYSEVAARKIQEGLLDPAWVEQHFGPSKS
ncbi:MULTISPECIES: ATPase, T2SS/T4P/T4SS family [Achromobacter]|uniref:ATPase, T2SS/T4P/T4SS family n=1 Tax=Achromobacter TaxID=222 RepID=UPI0023F95202|nr:ATPase, T2SS/T4P/T4SS family [Achromobacter anxifer]MDF8363282.1 ATPase, T2SS/T4P/T4SS family [Achromobacter anxifer]